MGLSWCMKLLEILELIMMFLMLCLFAHAGERSLSIFVQNPGGIFQFFAYIFTIEKLIHFNIFTKVRSSHLL